MKKMESTNRDNSSDQAQTEASKQLSDSKSATDLTPMRAWRAKFRHRGIVIARTKERATELLGEMKHGLDRYWEECSGEWWHSLAQQESVWAQQTDSDGASTGEFRRCFSVKEATVLLKSFVAIYRTFETERLLGLIEQGQAYEGETRSGIVFRLDIEAWRSPRKLTIHFRVNDGIDVSWISPICLEREIPNERVEWKTNGF